MSGHFHPLFEAIYSSQWWMEGPIYWRYHLGFTFSFLSGTLF
ncbi:MAG: hypothetical protein QF619_04020 [Candidatus Binatia bacterium]|nr:hypothetical protein [Candidatus Binatia bacterium]